MSAEGSDKQPESKTKDSGPQIVEAYRRIGDREDRFDIEFWQAQGEQAIFQAALELVLDAEFLRTGHAVEPRLERTVEYFHRP